MRTNWRKCTGRFSSKNIMFLSQISRKKANIRITSWIGGIWLEAYKTALPSIHVSSVPSIADTLWNGVTSSLIVRLSSSVEFGSRGCSDVKVSRPNEFFELNGRPKPECKILITHEALKHADSRVLSDTSGILAVLLIFENCFPCAATILANMIAEKLQNHNARPNWTNRWQCTNTRSLLQTGQFQNQWPERACRWKDTDHPCMVLTL